MPQWKPLLASPATNAEVLHVQRLLISFAVLNVSTKNKKNTHTKKNGKIRAIATIVIPDARTKTLNRNLLKKGST